MRTQNDYVIDNILLFHSQSHLEKPTERDYTATSMPAPGEKELHGTFPPSTPGPSCRTYEIVMVSLCGSIFLLAVVIIALKAIRKRVVLRVQSQGKSSRPSQELAASKTAVASIVAKYDGDQVLTAQVDGPAYIRYEAEMEAPPVPDPEGKPDSDMMLSFSFTSSISPLDTSPKQ